MCGRYSLFHPWEEVAEYYGIVGPSQNLPPRYNIAPTQKAAVIRAGDGGRTFGMLRWGLLPGFAKDTRMAARFINARSETAATQGAFRDAYRKRRCLVAADGFYEWRKAGKARLPYRIEPPGGGLIAFAGLWQPWRVRDGLELKGEYAEYGPGDVIETFTILTTEPNDNVAELHNRMPVIVLPDHFDAWLSGADEADGASLLRPYPETLDVRRVNMRVNSVVNDDAGCIGPPDDGEG